MKILIVEDEQLLAASVGELLKKKGFDVEIVRSTCSRIKMEGVQ